MLSLLAEACWPSRFFTKWLAAFFGAIAFGMVLAAFMPHPRKNVQSGVVVLVSYTDSPRVRAVPAKVYFASSPREIIENKVFVVSPKGPALRTQAGGLPIDFMVQPLDDKGGKEGDPVQRTVRWPDKEGQTITIKIEREYPKPKRVGKT